MARKRTSDEPLPPPHLTRPRSELESQIQERLNIGRKLLDLSIQSEQELEQARADRQRWSSFNTELLVRSFDNKSIADDYNWSPGFGMISMNPSLGEKIEDFRESVRDWLNRLQSILERLPLIPEGSGVLPTRTSQEQAPLSPAAQSVFIVHGRDQAARETVARFIERLGLTAIILHEQANQGRTLIEKFEANAQVAFAIVLLTADDTCNPGISRARQNVIFELGYFFGTLGRKRVAALYVPGVELPSDVQGLAYIEWDSKDAWRFLLARELAAAGLPVDASRLL
jgi:Predicted nucleotide-binding protein containing TIR-like domain